MSHQQLSQQTPSTSNPTPKVTTPSPETAGDRIRRDLASLSSEHLSGPEGGTVALHTALVPPAGSSDNSTNPAVTRLPASSAVLASPSRLPRHSILHSSNPHHGNASEHNINANQSPQILDIEPSSNRPPSSRSVSFLDGRSMLVEGNESHGGSSRGGRGVQNFVSESLNTGTHGSQLPSTSRTQSIPQPSSLTSAPQSRHAFPVLSTVNATSLPWSTHLDDDHNGVLEPLTPDHPFARPPASQMMAGTSRDQELDSTSLGGREDRTTRSKRFRMSAVPPSQSSPISPLANPIINPSRLGNALDHTDMDAGYVIPPVPPGTFLGAEAGLTTDNKGIRDGYSDQRRRDISGVTAWSRTVGGGGYPSPRRERGVGPSRTHGSPKHANDHPYLVQNRTSAPHRSHRPQGQDHSARRGQNPLSPVFQLPDPYIFPSGHTTNPLPPLLGAIRWAISGFGISSSSSSGSSGSSGESMSARPGPATGGENTNAIPLQEATTNIQEGAKQPLSPTSPAQPTKLARIPSRTKHAPPRQSRATRPFGREREPDVDYDLVRAKLQRIALKDDKQKLEKEKKELEEEKHRLEKEKAEFELQKTQGARPGPTTGTIKAGPETIIPVPVGTLPRPHTGAQGTPPGKGPNVGGSTLPRTRLSPPKASPALHAASDPVSPVKRPSAFSMKSVPEFIKDHLGDKDIKELQQALTLWQYVSEVFVVQIYRHVMLRLPSLYLNRVDRIYAEASLTSLDVEALVRLGQITGPESVANEFLDRPSRDSRGEHEPLMQGFTQSNSNSPYIGASLNLDDPGELEAGLVHANIDPNQAKDILHKLNRFRLQWEAFIDGLVKEWKTLNVVSALLISALLTVFQISEATFQPVTRTAALLSLVSAFLSLMFGGMYILRFSTMRTMRKAHKWVQETAKSKETRKVIWNIWVMLSLPVTWLAWSLIFFCVALISFVWTSGNGKYLTAPTSSDTAAVILVPRILVTLLFLIGCLYFGFVLNTFRVWALPPKPVAPTLRELVMNSTVVASGFATPLGTPRYFNATSPPTGQQGRRDGLRDLANINVPHSTKAERMAAIADHLDGRSTYSAPSMLGLDVSPGHVHSAVPLGFTSPPVVATPPTLIPATELPVPPGPQELAVPITTITEASSSRAGDPLMGAEARWARATDQETEDDDATHSPTFERSNQATALDSILPDSSQPLAMIPEMSEFGSSSRSRFLGSRGVEANLSNVSPSASAATGAGAGQAQAGEEKGKRGWFKAMGGSSPKSGERDKEKKSPMGKLADLLH